jgi:hypothetical protein
VRRSAGREHDLKLAAGLQGRDRRESRVSRGGVVALAQVVVAVRIERGGVGVVG